MAKPAGRIQVIPGPWTASLGVTLLCLLGLANAASADEGVNEKALGSLLDSSFTLAIGGFFAISCSSSGFSSIVTASPPPRERSAPSGKRP